MYGVHDIIYRMFNQLCYLLRPRERLRSIVMRYVCLCVCFCVCLSVREDISGTTGAIFTNFCACCLCPWFGPPPAVAVMIDTIVHDEIQLESNRGQLCL